MGEADTAALESGVGLGAGNPALDWHLVSMAIKGFGGNNKPGYNIVGTAPPSSNPTFLNSAFPLHGDSAMAFIRTYQPLWILSGIPELVSGVGTLCVEVVPAHSPYLQRGLGATGYSVR